MEIKLFNINDFIYFMKIIIIGDIDEKYILCFIYKYM